MQHYTVLLFVSGNRSWGYRSPKVKKPKPPQNPFHKKTKNKLKPKSKDKLKAKSKNKSKTKKGKNKTYRK